MRNQEQILGAAQQDVAALRVWRDLVNDGKVEFDQRYLREYLTGSRYNHFDEALVRLIDMLDLPGVGRILSGTLWLLRTPYRLAKGLIVKALTRPEAPALPEQPILEQALNGWLDYLRKEAARRSLDHPLWKHIEHGFSSGLPEGARERFAQAFRGYQLGLATEVDTTARNIYEALEKKPILLNTLRGGKLALDVAVIAGTLAAGPLTSWHHLITVPLAASVTHQLVELMGRQYVDSQRESARLRQQALMSEQISGPLAEWLIEWPTTGGSDFERMQQALRRLPDSIVQLNDLVNRRANTPPKSPDEGGVSSR